MSDLLRKAIFQAFETAKRPTSADMVQVLESTIKIAVLEAMQKEISKDEPDLATFLMEVFK